MDLYCWSYEAGGYHRGAVRYASFCVVCRRVDRSNALMDCKRSLRLEVKVDCQSYGFIEEAALDGGVFDGFNRGVDSLVSVLFSFFLSKERMEDSRL